MPTVVDEIEARPGTQDAWAQLRALRVAEGQGWARVVAADLAEGRHTVEVLGTLRTLHRGEVLWWAVGLGDGNRGRGDLVAEVAGERVPELVTVAEAAAAIPGADRWGNLRGGPMTVNGVAYNIAAGDLYGLYGRRRELSLFRAQVVYVAAARHAAGAALAGRRNAGRLADRAEEARREWMAVRELLPDVHRPATLGVDVTPTPSPVPLPVTGAQEPTRQRRALLIGDGRGWYRYLGQVEGGHAVKPTRRARFAVPSEGALAWVLGVADAHGEGASVAYREGLG